MRLRLAVLASVVTTLVAVALPSAVIAAPRHNQGLTINVIPNPILAGEGVFIYGRLTVPPVADQTITLYHHLAGSGLGYTVVQRAKTDAQGYYVFPRAEDVVLTNRSWFTREAGIHGVHSRTVYEQVAALVSLTSSTSTAVTAQPITFTGSVTPNHAGNRIELQELNTAGTSWVNLKSAIIGPGSNFAIVYRWAVPGSHDVRALFPGDARNVRGASNPVTVTIQQKQVAGFTINTSDPIIAYGQSATISGVLSGSSSAGTPVTLWARNAYQSTFTPIADTTTGAGGSYTFPAQTPSYNTLYQVRTTLAPRKHTAVLFEGVQDVVSMTPSSTTSTVGQSVTFTGTVLPDKAGDWIYLQRLGADGNWHNVEIRTVTASSTFQFGWTFGKAGSYEFRARIYSDHANVGGASTPVTISVSPPSSVTTLPPAS
jgi:hypothetical protein